ncbi:MAG: nucleotidyltransferase family protein [Bacteroidales bacterium]|nr:nucleotidyltransferase family protein [Bacteroidales bacterium]MDZ4205562.1 nucleotidyltransferase family protein [Bacteroidales bacterium]
MHEAIILAGGLGTRLQPVLKDIPKVMAPIGGRPFLEYLLDYMLGQNISHIVLSVGYQYQQVIYHFGNKYRDIELTYAIENEPLGTGGGIMLAMQQCHQDEVLIFNGDTLFTIDTRDFLYRHLHSIAPISIAMRQVEDVSRYGQIRTDERGLVTAFGEKSDKPEPGWINGGIYLINRNFFTYQNFTVPFSIEKDCFTVYYKQKLISGFPYHAYFLDIGVPEDFERAQDEFTRLAY